MSDVILRDSAGAETPLALSSPPVARLCHAMPPQITFTTIIVARIPVVSLN